VTANEAMKLYGQIVYQDPLSVVRVKRKDDGLWVVTHNVINGKEIIPKEYELGVNASIQKI
jgi:hypothetical protein